MRPAHKEGPENRRRTVTREQLTGAAQEALAAIDNVASVYQRLWRREFHWMVYMHLAALGAAISAVVLAAFAVKLVLP